MLTIAPGSCMSSPSVTCTGLNAHELSDQMARNRTDDGAGRHDSGRVVHASSAFVPCCVAANRKRWVVR